MSTQDIERALLTVSLEEARRFRDLLDGRLQTEGGGDGAPGDSQETVPYERIAHLAGVVKGGPADLSSNKAYLADLGGTSRQ